MKKLRCTSCGAELKVEDNNEYAICEHCGSRYKLKDDLNINIKVDDDIKKVITSSARGFSKFMLIPIVMFVVVFCLIIFFAIKSRIDFNNKVDENKQKNEEQQEIMDKLNEKSEKQLFNWKFTSAAGTKSAFFVKEILDDIIESNKIYDRKINLLFNGKTMNDENDIISIKHSLNDKDNYEVSKNYDDNGYINEIKVEKIN